MIIFEFYSSLSRNSIDSFEHYVYNVLNPGTTPSALFPKEFFMVRESRLAWNDGDRERLDDWRLPISNEDEEDAPLEPPPKRRCTRRGRLLGRDRAEAEPPTNPDAQGDQRPAA